MSFFKVVVEIAAELLIQKNPYEKYSPPEIVSETRDGCGRVVQQTVKAHSGQDATRHLQGTTIQGDRTVVATQTSPGEFDVHIEDLDR